MHSGVGLTIVEEWTNKEETGKGAITALVNHKFKGN